MKTAIRVASLALFLTLVGNAKVEAQYRAQDWWWGFSYQTALTAGETKDFIDQFSWRNIGLEGRTMVNANASVGFYFGWNVFNDELDGTVSLGGVDVSGYQSRYINAVPMMATAHVYLGQPRGPRPFIGAGVGTYWIENQLELGATAITVDNWHFGVAPEAGFIFPTQGMMEGFASAKYNMAFEADGIEHRYWTFSLGLAARY